MIYVLFCSLGASPAAPHFARRAPTAEWNAKVWLLGRRCPLHWASLSQKDYVNKQPKYIQYVNIFLCSQKEIWLKCLRGIRAANAKEC